MGKGKSSKEKVQAQKSKFKQRRGRSKQLFKATKEYNTYFSIFDEEMNRRGLCIKDVDGDGNCLFRAIADQVEGDEEVHMIYRAQCCRLLDQERQFYAPFLDEDDGGIQEYINYMKKQKSWGGELELLALCKAARLKIKLYRKGQLQPSIYESQNPLRLISLCYFTHDDFDHYASVRKLGQRQGPAFEKVAEWDQQQQMLRQLQDLRVGQKAEQVLVEPFPGLGRNKKCGCRSGLAYKDCCLKTFIKARDNCFQ